MLRIMPGPWSCSVLFQHKGQAGEESDGAADAAANGVSGESSHTGLPSTLAITR